ncbi:MAG: hypothetical protein HY360_01525 [Verrucomicrobia bacterium]|nr:hypothetical protein [Verrucomicrobiota bacterium]
MAFWIIVVLAFFAADAQGMSDLIHSVCFLPFTGSERLNGLNKKAQVLGDRFEYGDDDANGQFYAVLPEPAGGIANCKLRILVRGEDGKIATETVAPDADHRKVHFLLQTAQLDPGSYIVEAAMLDSDGKATDDAVRFSFSRVRRSRPTPKFPRDGLPIELHEQNALANADWPIRAGIPLPPNAVSGADSLTVFENGKRIPSQVTTRATWSPDGPPRWVHVHFVGRYRNGKAAAYRLRRASKQDNPLQSALHCEQTEDKIVVNTGVLKFEVGRKRFAGIERAWFDPSGQQQYDDAHLVIRGDGGPYLVDERGIRWESALDSQVEVAVEEQNEARVVIAISGWHQNPAARAEPLCPFKTRMIAHVGSPLVRVQHHVIIGFDTTQHQLADIGFRIATPRSERFRLGMDDMTIAGDLPEKQPVFLHQDRYDHLRVVGHNPSPMEGRRSDGWFAARNAGNGITLTALLRDVWQKFPKEVEMSRDGIILHFWPAHGHRAFNREEELDQRNIYKFWCFHQGPLLDLRLPADYFQALKGMPGVFENTPEIAQAGNAMGAVIGNEFALMFTADENAGDLPGWAQLFQEDPAGRAPPAWNAATLAMGLIAAADRKHFSQIEDCVEKGFLSYTKAVQRGNEYGMFNYADTHTYWNVKENFAELHRVWHNSHYHEAGATWQLYHRSGSKDLLDWARASTDHYMNIGTVNYAPPNDPRDNVEQYVKAKPVIVDGKVQASAKHWWLFRTHDPDQAPWYRYIDTILNIPPDEQPPRHIRFIIPGAMYHCKGLTHWGKKDYAMNQGEAHAWIWGHWMDPDASLWCWYLDAQPRAWDVYQMWHQSVRKYGLPLGGVAREINTALACAVDLYQATWDADLLPAIHGMAASLRTTEPLDQQQPGGMWHPLWINRYYNLTRDPEYVPFIRTYANNPGVATALGLPALGYEVTGDKAFLFQHFDKLRKWPKGFFHKPDDPYDWYGQGPGPIGSSWWYDTWGSFLYQMQRAGMTDFDAVPPQPGDYPACGSSFDDIKARPGVVVYILENKDRAFDLSFGLQSLGGDLHPTSIVVYSPSGKTLDHIPRVPDKGGPSSWKGNFHVEPDGETGLYRVEYRSHACSVHTPVAAPLDEAALLPPKIQLRTWRIDGCLLPIDESRPTQLAIRSESDRTPLNFVVRDAKDEVVAEGSLFAPRDLVSQTILLDPKKHPLPWNIAATGLMSLQHEGTEDGLLLGPTSDAVRTIMRAMKKQ